MQFYWFKDLINGDYINHAAILIPIKIKDNNYLIQLDTGTKSSIIYKDALTFFTPNEGRSNNLHLNFVCEYKIHDLTFKIDNETNCEVFNNIPIIGLLGLDFILAQPFLSIDFLNQNISFSNSLIEDSFYSSYPFEIKSGFISFEVPINNKNYYLMWDSGASFIDLFGTNDFWELLSGQRTANKNIETISLSGAYGSTHVLLKDKVVISFSLFNKEMKGKNVYCNKIYSPLTDLSSIEIDGLIGNILFLKNTITLDFKNKTLLGNW